MKTYNKDMCPETKYADNYITMAHKSPYMKKIVQP